MDDCNNSYPREKRRGGGVVHLLLDDGNIQRSRVEYYSTMLGSAVEIGLGYSNVCVINLALRYRYLHSTTWDTYWNKARDNRGNHRFSLAHI